MYTSIYFHANMYLWVTLLHIYIYNYILYYIILYYIILYYYIISYYIIWLYYTCTSYIFHNLPYISRCFPIFARQLPPGECQGSHPVLALQRFLRVGLAAEFHVGRRSTGSTAARRGKDGVEASSVRPGIYLHLGYYRNSGLPSGKLT